MIDRRQMLLAGAGGALLPSPALAQTLEKVRRVAVISPSQSSADEIRKVVLPELAKMGFAEGRNLIVTMHVGTPPELPGLARQALALMPEVVIASTNAGVRAIFDISATVPIVMAFAGEDPVAAGLAKSLARPGGSVTGLTNQATELDGKHVSQIHEAVPAARRIGVLAVPPPRHVDSIREAQRIGRLLGLEVQPFYASEPPAYAAAFAEMRSAQIEALVLASAPEHVRDAAVIARLALEAGLPTIGEASSMARDGCLIGYGPDRIVFRRRAADFVARILRGTPPGDLPIEQPTIFEMVVNLVTAKKLGLDIPLSIRASADEVIE